MFELSTIFPLGLTKAQNCPSISFGALSSDQSVIVQGELRTPVFEGQTDFLVFLLLSLGLFRHKLGASAFAIVEPLAALLLGSRSTRSRVQKFAQSSLEMIFYGAFFVFESLLSQNRNGFGLKALAVGVHYWRVIIYD